MFDEIKLWKDRAGNRVKDLGKYLRYIFNGHLVIVLLFLIGSAGFYYEKWVKTLPGNFPVEIIMAILIGLFLTYSPVYNFLFEADQVFLIPLEEKLKRYFFRSGAVSLLFQGYILLIVLAAFMPMYAHVNKNSFRSFLPFLFILLAVKAWNLATGWRIGYFVQSRVQKWDIAVRYLINISFCYLLFKHANLLFLLIIAIVMVFYMNSFFVRSKKMGLKWNQLIEQEEKRMGSFYRFANLFTDVPQLRDTVKRRRWLDLLISRIPFLQSKTYKYLYSRTFLRSSDYLGLFVRLTIIGIFALYFISYGFGQILLVILFLYLTGFQLLPLWHHHQNKLWVDLYPVEEKHKLDAFHSLMMVILTVQTVLFALFILLKSEPVLALLGFLAGMVFNYIFIYFYSKNRLKS
jgi:ABC-2 type transport system permease protein